MPLFSRKINANGNKSDNHDYLTDELVPHYLKEQGADALKGYTDGVVDMIWTINDLRKKETTFEGLQQKLEEFIAIQLEFVERTDSGKNKRKRRLDM